jgi:hypothetical protein
VRFLGQDGLRYHGKAIAPGAQTDHRARPGRCAIRLAADTHRPYRQLGGPYPGGTTVTVAVRVIPLAVSVAVMV